MYEELTKSTNSIYEMYRRSNYLLNIVSTYKGMHEALKEKSFNICKVSEFISDFNQILIYFPSLAASLAKEVIEYLEKDCKKEAYYMYLRNYLSGNTPSKFTDLVPESYNELTFKLEMLEKHNIFLSNLQQLEAAIKGNCSMSADILESLSRYYTFTMEDYTKYKELVDKIPENSHKLSEFRKKMYGKIN